MKLTSKVAILVAASTLALLGSYYVLSIVNARNAIIDFQKSSSITIGQALASDEQILTSINNIQPISNTEQLFIFLGKHYPDQLFAVFQKKQLFTDNFSRAGINLSSSSLNEGLQLKLTTTGGYQSTINFIHPGFDITIQDQIYSLIWIPETLANHGKKQERLKEQLNNDFTLVFLLLSLIAILLAWGGAWHFLRPLKVLKVSFHQLEQGRLDTRMNFKRRDEVGEIIHSFNHLAAWLEGMNKQYKQLSSDLAHELRTPLTGMQSRIEAIQDGIVPSNPDQLKLLLSDLYSLKRIVEDLNLLSLTEARQLKIHTQPAVLANVVAEVHDSYAERAGAEHMQMPLKIADQRQATIDVSRLRQVLVNLLDNGFKYATSGGYLGLAVEQEGLWITIKVQDRGPGLSEEQRGRIFERFYRQDPARSDKESLGLGLAISRQLTELMNGKLEVSSQPGNGCIFTLSFQALS